MRDYGRIWRSLDDLKRKKYMELAKVGTIHLISKDKEKYQKYTSSKIGKKDKRLPKRRKRVMNAFLRFSREMEARLPQIKAMNFLDKNKELSRRWLNLDKTDKYRYRVEYLTEKKASEKAHQEKVINSLKSYGKKDTKNCVKKIHQPFVRFALTHMKETRKANPNETYHGCLKILGNRWRNLEDIEKTKY